MTWHYLPVIVETSPERFTTLIHVYVDNQGALELWTALEKLPDDLHGIAGNDREDLIGSLELMLRDARRWKPVPYDELYVGYVPELIEDE